MSATAIDTGRDFVALTGHVMPRLQKLALNLAHCPSAADDLVQETLTKAWANWHTFDRGGALGAWLCRIMINAFNSAKRHERVVQRVGARADIRDHLYGVARVHEADDPETCWSSTVISDDVRQAIADLPRHYREAIVLVDVRGRTYKEAAETLGCPLGTIMSRLHRARRILREQIEVSA